MLLRGYLIFPRTAVSIAVALVVVACGGNAHRIEFGDGGPDFDGDGYSSAAGDCDDGDPTVYPGAPEICGDRRDQNCDGVPDETCDNDQDGSSIAQGDCDDTNPLVGPRAVELVGNGIDDDCDGAIDELDSGCDATLAQDGQGMAAAVELCAPWVVSSSISMGSDPRSHAVRRRFGLYEPHGGASLVVLSTGIAADASDASFVLPQPGTEFGNDAPNPVSDRVVQNQCYDGPVEPLVHDYVEWTLQLRVPQNASSLSFDFLFVTSEFPEFLCSQYNDAFFALLESKAFKGNVSFDAKGQPVTVNVGFFDVCQRDEQNPQTANCDQSIDALQGTGYERFDFMNRAIGGGTGWLRTFAPVVAGETITLRFILFDEGDHRFDSTVLIDNVQWQLTPSSQPATVQ